MRIVPLAPVGARVEGVALKETGADEIALLRGVLAEHGVVVLPGQDVSDADFAAFLRRFGPLAFTAGETPVAGCADLNLISNVGRAAAPRSSFHVDTSYVRVPPAYTALRAVRIPARGGETLFSNQVRALQTLSPELRRQVSGRTMTHVVTGVDVGPEDETTAVHRLVRSHPLTGQQALYLTVPARCREISGLSLVDSSTLVRTLYDHSTQEGNVLRHRWRRGDVVMWDNAVVMHRADHSSVVGERVMHRGMVAGTGEGTADG